MAVERGALMTQSDMNALAVIANRKAIAGKPYKFLPEFWEVASEAEMLRLRWADRSDRPGGIAIRSDTLTAYQFTGGDYRSAGSWSAYPAIKVVATLTGLNALPG